MELHEKITIFLILILGIGFIYGFSNINKEKLSCQRVKSTKMDCLSFSNSEMAQSMYEESIDCYGYDYFKLDKNKNGVACEFE